MKIALELGFTYTLVCDPELFTGRYLWYRCKPLKTKLHLSCQRFSSKQTVGVAQQCFRKM